MTCLTPAPSSPPAKPPTCLTTLPECSSRAAKPWTPRKRRRRARRHSRPNHSGACQRDAPRRSPGGAGPGEAPTSVPECAPSPAGPLTALPLTGHQPPTTSTSHRPVQIIATPIPSATAVTLGDDDSGDYIIDPPPIPVEKRQVQIEQLVLDPAFSPMAWAMLKRASLGPWRVFMQTCLQRSPSSGATPQPCP